MHADQVPESPATLEVRLFALRPRSLAAGLLVFSWLLCTAPGCTRSCEDARDAVEHRFYGECGQCCSDDGPVYACDEADRQTYECQLSCLDGVSCAAIIGEDIEGSKKLWACFDYCNNVIEPAEPPRPESAE